MQDVSMMQAVKTADGSFTVFNSTYNQHYRSLHGAQTESAHVYVNARFKAGLSEKPIVSVFELGFGTGTNFFQALQAVEVSNTRLIYMTAEIEPVPFEQMVSLLPDRISGNLEARLNVFFSALREGWNVFESEKCTLHYFWGDLFQIDYIPHTADFIFHDGFSPAVNPDVWSAEAFAKIKHWSSNDVLLSTYVASANARAAMAKAGWFIAKADGPPGKREMTFAALQDHHLTAFKRLNRDLLAGRCIG